MELKKQVLRQNTEKSRAFTQITLDDDCIVKDNKPDVIKIIHTRGSVSFEESKVSSQTVWVTGRLQFTVLYRSDEKSGKLESLTDSVAFGEKLILDGVEELDAVKLTGKLEDLAISAINSRKLAVRALIGIYATAEQQRQEELVNAVLDEDDVQQRQEEKEMLLLVTSKKDILRTHNEANLPGARPNIGRIIYHNVDIRNREVTLSGGRVQLAGEAYVTVLYASEEGQLEWYDVMIPVSGSMDMDDAAAESLYWIRTGTADIELEAVNDYDGEMRTISLDIVFDMDIKVWREETVQVLTDAYALNRRLIPKYEPMSAWKLLMKNMAKLRVSEQLGLESGQERILQLCSYEGEISIDQVEQVENGLSVEGILLLHILYATADDSFPVGHAFSQVPFAQVIDVPGLSAQSEGVTYELEPGIDQLQVNLLDNDKYEVKATLSLSALVLSREQFNRIEEIGEEPFDVESLQGQPGLTGFVAQTDEDLWSIAKQYHTTEQELVAANGLKSPKLRAGDKIIIVKSVS